ncbi:MAG: hypothetical protein O3C40_30085 [Planctomycetota bacterium]|nr:hypothetical protein [Planctomycetota bacterium]
MKLQLFAVSAAIILLTSAISNAGNGYFNQLGRINGYGISDGYHAQRYCLPACKSCGNCSPVQSPMNPQPMMGPAYSQWAPHQLQQAGYPIGYPVTPTYQPWYQPFAPGYGQPVMPSIASPYRTPALRW